MALRRPLARLAAAVVPRFRGAPAPTLRRERQQLDVAADAYARDSVGGHAYLFFQCERAVDGREGMPAAGVVLDRHPRDVESLPKGGERALPGGSRSHPPAKPRLAFHDV